MFNELKKKINYNILFALFLFSYFISVIINLGTLPLDGEEPRRALISIEMLRSGNFISPTVFQWPYFNKPPIYNWLMSAVMFITNSSKEWAVRLPSLISIIIWSLVNYFLVRKFFPNKIAILSSIFLLTSLDLFFYALSNGGEIDIFYSLIVYLQIISIFYFNHIKKWLHLFLYSYLFCAIGFLTKGFPSLVFQGFTLMAIAYYNQSIKIIFSKFHLVGIILFLVSLGIYLITYSNYNDPQILLVNLINESFRKSAVGEHSERVWSKVLIYPLSFLKLLLPWSLILLLLFKKHRIQLFQNPLVKFSILFIAFNLWIYAFTGRPILRYVYMFIPFAYIVITFLYWNFNNQFPGWISNALKYFVIAFILLFIGIIVLPFFYPAHAIWVASLSFLIGLLIYFYLKVPDYRIWLFAFGIILSRLAYATLFIPLKYNYTTLLYDKEMKQLVNNNHHQPIHYWSPPEKYAIEIDLKYAKWKYDSIITPPFVYYQIPYYIFYNTHEIVTYDTSMEKGNTYFTYDAMLKNKEVIRLDSFYDSRQKANFIIFKAKQ